jgi:hypothetical protein
MSEYLLILFLVVVGLPLIGAVLFATLFGALFVTKLFFGAGCLRRKKD